MSALFVMLSNIILPVSSNGNSSSVLIQQIRFIQKYIDFNIIYYKNRN